MSAADFPAGVAARDGHTRVDACLRKRSLNAYQ